jgi:hypothetical protein
MRPSTVRKLNALKTKHPDVNALLNTIVDMAVSHYYNYIFSEKRSFGIQEVKKVVHNNELLNLTQVLTRNYLNNSSDFSLLN